MKCEAIQDLLTQYLLGDLDEATATEVREHLDQCDGCRAAAREIEPTLDLLRDALVAPSGAPERLSTAHRARILHASQRPKARPGGALRWVIQPHPRLAVAAGFVVVLGLLWAMLLPARLKSRCESSSLKGRQAELERDLVDLGLVLESEMRVHPDRPDSRQRAVSGTVPGDSFSYEDLGEAGQDVTHFDTAKTRDEMKSVDGTVSVNEGGYKAGAGTKVHYWYANGDKSEYTTVVSGDEGKGNKETPPRVGDAPLTAELYSRSPQKGMVVVEQPSQPSPDEKRHYGEGRGTASERLRERRYESEADEARPDNEQTRKPTGEVLGYEWHDRDRTDRSGRGWGWEAAGRGELRKGTRPEPRSGQELGLKDVGGKLGKDLEKRDRTLDLTDSRTGAEGGGIGGGGGQPVDAGRGTPSKSTEERNLDQWSVEAWARPGTEPGPGTGIAPPGKQDGPEKSRRVQLLGEVKHGGVHELPDGEAATLSGLLMKDGGLPPYANQKRVKIVRRGEDGKDQEITVDANRILREGDPSADFELKDGDRIIVPARRFSLDGGVHATVVAEKPKARELGDEDDDIEQGRGHDLHRKAVESAEYRQKKTDGRKTEFENRRAGPAPEDEDEAKEEERTGPRFKAFGANPFYPAAERRFSTFAIDVDTAAYTLARNYMSRGYLPPAEAVRTEEFVNFFDYNDAPPAHGTFKVYASAAPSKFGRGMQLLKIGVKGRRLGREEQRRATLTFLIDTSGSMDTRDRLELVRKSLRMLVQQLAPQDRVAIIQYGSHARLVLEHTPAARKQVILAAIDGLQCGGSTNLEQGMDRAYQVASQAFAGGRENRVLLLSDGVANLGNMAAEDILGKVETYRKQGITCSVFGFGIGTYDDVMLETLANKGDGTYAFVDSEDEAKRIFVDDLAATLNTIASDVKIQVEFNPERVKTYRQLGYENRQLKKEDFRNNAVDAGEVGSGQSVTALYEVQLQPATSPAGVGRSDKEARKVLATVRVRYRRVDNGKIEEIEHQVTGADVTGRFDDADTRFRLAACVAEFAEILRGSPFAAGSEFEEVAAVLRPVALDLNLDRRVQELLRFVQGAHSMSRGQLR